MKRLMIFIILTLSISVIAQQFRVDKIKGIVLVQRGIQEEFTQLNKGDVLNGDDLIMTDKNSFIQLDKDGSKFILNENSALGLNYLKKISINDLLLALAMEEIRNVPKDNNKNMGKNTAVYGEETTIESSVDINSSSLGIMKINGAKQLAQSGYKESAIIVAKETNRKYPSTGSIASDRIFFADILFSLELINEALEEYSAISEMKLNNQQSNEVNNKIEQVKFTLISK